VQGNAFQQLTKRRGAGEQHQASDDRDREPAISTPASTTAEVARNMVIAVESIITS
jgi:hypothetical protein